MDTVLLAEKYSKLQLSDDDVKVVGVDLSGDPRVCINTSSSQTITHPTVVIIGR